MNDSLPTTLPSTGERLLTDWHNESIAEHLHRYALAATLSAGKNVLDIACGEGYGSNLLAATAGTVVGVDIAPDAVDHAKAKYQRSNLRFAVGSAFAVPLDAHSIDVAVSFETLEHHAKHEEMLSELHRVLKPNGLLIISTPDKRNYSDLPKYSNPYHVKELYVDEFRQLVARHFKNAALYFQTMNYGSLIVPEKDSTGFNYLTGDFEQTSTTSTLPDPKYVLCVASDGALPVFPPSTFSANVLFLERKKRLETLEVSESAMTSQLRDLENSVSLRIGRALTAPIRWFLG